MGLLDRGNRMLTRSLGVAGGVTVAYQRGLVVVSVTDAVPGDPRHETRNQTGPVKIDSARRDYLIPVAGIAALGEPAAGDRVIQAVNGTSRTYKVTPPTDGEPAWRWSDAEQTVYRVHCEEAAD
jgi:hypothetical protein